MPPQLLESLYATNRRQPISAHAAAAKKRLVDSTSGVGNYFARRARFGKTVEDAGRTLIGKQGEDLFWGDHGLRTNVISKIRGFHLVFYSNFATLRLIFCKSLPSVISKGKKRSSAKFTVRI